ncbi:MFS transporter [Ancylobacter sp. MQZ15Z-1]|uniref:MFS transporter n=1 Tax=Ancylobacter mangrovi TaxID=2972472 RepID=A0A9X2T903_9HYPH|nr:MFS transporter [Ancylobacter mangrovi]MCS0497693.1 MFS transporter [Ancylobacter mangrovi]
MHKPLVRSEPTDAAVAPLAARPPGPAAGTRLKAVIVACAIFMSNLDGTAVVTALPSMARDLGLPPLHLSGAITAYLVALTVSVPVSGWLADRFGAKRLFITAIICFTIASALCSTANGLAEIILFRSLQGVGGAMMIPIGRLLVLRDVPREEFLTATTWLTTPALVGPVMGPLIGGFLTDLISWRAVFWINIPIGIAGIAMVARYIRDVPTKRPPPLDVTGMVLVAVSLAAIVGGLETIGRGLVPAVVPAACLAGGVVLALVLVRHSRRHPHPLVDLDILRIPTFGATMLAGCFVRIGMASVPFLIPLSMQIGFGLSATRSGGVLLASALGAFMTKPMVRFAIRVLNMRHVLMVNTLVYAASIASFSLLEPGWAMPAVFLLVLFNGVTRTISLTTMGALALVDVPSERMSAATPIFATAQQLPQALGVAVIAGTLQLAVMLSGSASAGLPQFHVGFLVAAAGVLLAVPCFARLPHDAGEGM